MPLGLETWRTSGKSCIYGTALGPPAFEMIGYKLGSTLESSTPMPIVQLNAPT